jgi:hypothetical protein
MCESDRWPQADASTATLRGWAPKKNAAALGRADCRCGLVKTLKTKKPGTNPGFQVVRRDVAYASPSSSDAGSKKLSGRAFSLMSSP